MAAFSKLELTLRSLARQFAAHLVTLACGSNIDSLAGLDLELRVSSAGKSRPAVKHPGRLVSVDERVGYGALVRGKSVNLAHTMANAVASLPWPPRSRELQALLGLSKGQFIRVAVVAIRMGLVHRTGYKSGIQYFLGPGAPLAEAEPGRAASRARPPRIDRARSTRA